MKKLNVPKPTGKLTKIDIEFLLLTNQSEWQIAYQSGNHVRMFELSNARRELKASLLEILLNEQKGVA